jgi:3-oxoacyl-[acyl-carrier-protein] synthase III
MTSDDPVGIVATACAFPSATPTLTEICAEEGVELSQQSIHRLGIESVHASAGETGTDLALSASSTALEAAGLAGKQIDLIVDYTILPQEYLVPVWNLGNKLQYELDATNAFALGFSGGGSTNFLVALRFATDLIRANPELHTALLFGADMAIPGNRIINPGDPVTVLGDGASAVLLAEGAEHDVVIGVELASDGANHNTSYIPGGALAQLADSDRSDLYRLRIDRTQLEAAPRRETLELLERAVVDRTGVDRREIRHHVHPNVSAEDQALYRAASLGSESPAVEANRTTHGHVQATDLVLNLEAVTADGGCSAGDLVLMSSHGMGFTSGVAVLQH